MDIENQILMKCFFPEEVAANVSAFVVGSNPTGKCTLCKNTPGMGLLTDTLHLLL